MSERREPRTAGAGAGTVGSAGAGTVGSAGAGAGVVAALVALVVAVAVGQGVTRASLAGRIPSGWVADLTASACIWVPLLAGVVVAAVLWRRQFGAGGGAAAGAAAGAVGAVGASGAAAAAAGAPGAAGAGWVRGVVDRLGMRILPIDIVYGIVFGLLLRFVDAAVNVGVNGSTGLAPRAVLGDGPHGFDVVVLIVAPVLVSPLVEELFFRGLLQRSLGGVLAGVFGGGVPGGAATGRAAPGGASEHEDARHGVSTIVSVVLTAALFAFLHVAIVSDAPRVAFVTVVSTFAVGLAAGALVASTRRLGGAVLMHIVFNGVAVWLTWPR